MWLTVAEIDDILASFPASSWDNLTTDQKEKLLNLNYLILESDDRYLWPPAASIKMKTALALFCRDQSQGDSRKNDVMSYRIGNYSETRYDSNRDSRMYTVYSREIEQLLSEYRRKPRLISNVADRK